MYHDAEYIQSWPFGTISCHVSHCVFLYVSVPTGDSHRHQCLNKKKIKLTSLNGTIASSVSDLTGHGTANCPWVIEVKEGQRINLTLLDFGLWKRQQEDTASSSLYCHKYAIIQEGDQLQQTTVCGSRHRERVVFLSKTNKVTITVSRSNGDENAAQFILKYQGKPQSWNPIKT